MTKEEQQRLALDLKLLKKKSDDSCYHPDHFQRMSEERQEEMNSEDALQDEWCEEQLKRINSKHDEE